MNVSTMNSLPASAVRSLFFMSLVSACLSGAGDTVSASGTSTSTSEGETTTNPTTTTSPTTTTTTTTTTPTTTTNSTTNSTTATSSSTMTMEKCGNGKVEGMEECDDGNGDEEDGCHNDCTENVCGDGVQDKSKGGEECDDGAANGENAACTDDCTIAVCGDDKVYNTGSGDEECDGGGESADCNADCTMAMCGDGKINATAGEACDDGNANDADRCSKDCSTIRRLIFVTSTQHDGALAGLDGADKVCKGLAESAEAVEILKDATKNYRAWLSDGSESPSTRFSAADEMYAGDYAMIFIDGNQPPAVEIVATGWSGLSSAMHAAPILITETGSKLVQMQPSPIWTNTLPTGDKEDETHCMSWTTNQEKIMGVNVYGNIGEATSNSAKWTNGVSQSCTTIARLYCIEDP